MTVPLNPLVTLRPLLKSFFLTYWFIIITVLNDLYGSAVVLS